MIIDENEMTEWVVIGYIIPSIYLLAWWIGYGKDLMILNDYEGSIDID